MNAGMLLEALRKKMAKEKDFEYWEFLEKMEEMTAKQEYKCLGKIEDNVVIEGNVFLGKNSVIKSGTRIEGNVLIGENCVIGPNAYLRKNAIIGNNCNVINSEVKNSIILHNTKIPHFAYVGDSVIGENVNLGAGTKIANLRFDDKTIKVSIFGKRADSKRRKLGALVGSNTKTGINSSINCGKIVGRNCRIFPGTTVKKNLVDNENAL